jgi:hypothetical protein
VTWQRRTPAANRRRRHREERRLRADRAFVYWCEYFGRLGGEEWTTERRRRLLAAVTQMRRIGQAVWADGSPRVPRSALRVAVGHHCECTECTKSDEPTEGSSPGN